MAQGSLSQSATRSRQTPTDLCTPASDSDGLDSHDAVCYSAIMVQCVMAAWTWQECGQAESQSTGG